MMLQWMTVPGRDPARSLQSDEHLCTVISSGPRVRVSMASLLELGLGRWGVV